MYILHVLNQLTIALNPNFLHCRVVNIYGLHSLLSY